MFTANVAKALRLGSLPRRRLSAFTQFPTVPSLTPQIPGHLRDRLPGLADQPDHALPEIMIELPACLSHRHPLKAM